MLLGNARPLEQLFEHAEIVRGRATVYHYTTELGWKGIRARGLRPSAPTNLAMRQAIATVASEALVPVLPEATCCFERPQEGLGLLGTILYHVTGKAVQVVLELSVSISVPDDVWAPRFIQPDDLRIRVPHFGTIGEVLYHDDEPMVILHKTIHASRVQLVRVFDIAKAVEPGRSSVKLGIMPRRSERIRENAPRTRCR